MIDIIMHVHNIVRRDEVIGINRDWNMCMHEGWCD